MSNKKTRQCCTSALELSNIDDVNDDDDERIVKIFIVSLEQLFQFLPPHPQKIYSSIDAFYVKKSEAA